MVEEAGLEDGRLVLEVCGRLVLAKLGRSEALDRLAGGRSADFEKVEEDCVAEVGAGANEVL